MTQTKRQFSNLQLIPSHIMATPAPALSTRRTTAYKYLQLAPWLVARLSLDSTKPTNWTKLHCDLPHREELRGVSDLDRYHLILLMLHVQHTQINRLPNDKVFLSRVIGAQSEINLSLMLTNRLLSPCKRLRTKGREARPDKTRQEVREETDKTRARASSSSSSSKFSFDEILRYAHAHPSVKEPVKFAKKRSTDGAADTEVETWLRATRPPRAARKDCAACYGSGFDANSGAAKRCACVA